MHSDIKFVRTPRTAGKKNKEAAEGQGFKYAFIEFSSEEEAAKAKNKLSTTRYTTCRYMCPLIFVWSLQSRLLEMYLLLDWSKGKSGVGVSEERRRGHGSNLSILERAPEHK